MLSLRARTEGPQLWAMEKQAAARVLFNEGFTQKDIARIFRVTEATISRWSQDGDWREERIRNAMARETAEEGIWQLINYQIEVLSIKTKEWRDTNDKRLIDKGDIDALQKMFAAVKGKQQTWTHYVAVTRDLMEHMSTANPELAKQLVEHVDTFLNDRRTRL